MTIARRHAGVELGGTKTIALLADGDSIVARVQMPTGRSEETLARAHQVLAAWHDEAPLAAIGIASFGPIQLRAGEPDFGLMLPTPKPGWSGTDIAGALTHGIDCPWVLDTDVNGAALAEYQWGAGKGSSCFWYITIGTGLGGGLLIDGKPLHGAMHPEVGHIHIRRLQDDTFTGNCPFHGDCIEGLVSGPALAARFETSMDDMADNDPRWCQVAADLGEFTATLLLTTAAERILFGGGVVINRPFLMPMLREAVVERLAGYLPFVNQDTVEGLVCTAALGDRAGEYGAIALARYAFEEGRGLAAGR